MIGQGFIDKWRELRGSVRTAKLSDFSTVGGRPRPIFDRRDKNAELIEAYEHHIADLREQLTLERARSEELLFALGVVKREREEGHVEKPISPRPNWREVRRRVEEQDKAYAKQDQVAKAV